MNAILILLPIALLALLPLLAASCQRPDSHPSGYSLVFSDEFNGTSLDRARWCTRYIWGGGPTPQADPACTRNGDGNLDFLNDEQQRYVDTNRDGESMHVVGNGKLSLRATKTRNDGWASYESAMIRSKQVFRPTSTTSYYIAARVRMPDVVGTWPAFWLNSDRRPDGSVTWPPEIDIFDGAYNGRDDRAEMLHQATVVQGAQTSIGSRNYTYTAPEFDRTWNNYHAPESLRGKWVDTAVEMQAAPTALSLEALMKSLGRAIGSPQFVPVNAVVCCVPSGKVSAKRPRCTAFGTCMNSVLLTVSPRSSASLLSVPLAMLASSLACHVSNGASSLACGGGVAATLAESLGFGWP
mgnify:CR=1 FL=1